MQCRHLMEKMRNLFLRSQCFNKIFSTKSKKYDTIYMGIIFMRFLSRNLLFKNIYTTSSFMWSNELLSILKWWLYLYCIFWFSFLIYKFSYSKNVKLEKMRNLFLRLVFKPYFAELIFAIVLSKTVNYKNNFGNNFWSQKFLPLW